MTNKGYELPCWKCGTVTEVRPSGFLASHNEPANEDGYVGRCGNRKASKTGGRAVQSWVIR